MTPASAFIAGLTIGSILVLLVEHGLYRSEVIITMSRARAKTFANNLRKMIKFETCYKGECQSLIDILDPTNGRNL